MDPIEKLLSELAPAGSSCELDRAMGELFRRADSRAQWKRIAGVACGIGAALVVGVFAGYRLRHTPVPPAAPPSITYVVPMESSAFQALVEGPTRMPVISARSIHEDGA